MSDTQEQNSEQQAQDVRGSYPENKRRVFGPALTRRLWVEFKLNNFWHVLEQHGAQLEKEYEVVGATQNELIVLLDNGNILNVYPKNVRVTRNEDIRVVVELEKS
jgi:hypothetical protein